MNLGKIAKFGLTIALGYVIGMGVTKGKIARQPYQVMKQQGTFYFVDKGEDLKIKAEKVATMYNTVETLADLIQGIEVEAKEKAKTTPLGRLKDLKYLKELIK